MSTTPPTHIHNEEIILNYFGKTGAPGCQILECYPGERRGERFPNARSFSSSLPPKCKPKGAPHGVGAGSYTALFEKPGAGIRFNKQRICISQIQLEDVTGGTLPRDRMIDITTRQYYDNFTRTPRRGCPYCLPAFRVPPIVHTHLTRVYFSIRAVCCDLIPNMGTYAPH